MQEAQASRSVGVVLQEHYIIESLPGSSLILTKQSLILIINRCDTKSFIYTRREQTSAVHIG